ncbi:insulinase family protein [Pendulispora rubella]|uniref:Insulinase family protein n=1 Tax=Pendulispora rubella TaxID=2741070 RepID=A0ABZ2LFB9_9BACT
MLLATVLAGCKASLEPARSPVGAGPSVVRQMVFPSGLRVVAERDATSPVVGLFLVVDGGSASDPMGKEGLAHVVEHLSFRSRPFARSSFRRLLERAYAAEWNANTTMDATLYEEFGPASALSELLRLEGMRMLAPVANLMPEMLADELRVVRDELAARNETGFSGDVLASLQRAVFPPGHPYARPSLGTVASLASIQASDVSGFIKAHYQPANMTLVIVGDIDLATVDRTLEGVLPAELLHRPGLGRRMPVPAPVPEPPAPPPTRLSRTVGRVAHPEIWIAWSLPRAVDRDIQLVQMLKEEADTRLWDGEDDDIFAVDARVLPGKEATMLAVRVELSQGDHPEKSLERVLARARAVWIEKQWGNDDERFTPRKTWALGNLFETENLVRRGRERALTTHFTQNAGTFAEGIDRLVNLENTTFTQYVHQYLAPERARAIYVASASEGGVAPARPIGKYAVGEEDTSPLSIDEARLHDLAPGPGAGAYQRLSFANGLDVVIGRRDAASMVAVDFLFRGGYATAAQPAAAYLASLFTHGYAAGRPEPEAVPRGRSTFDKTQYAFEGVARGVGEMLSTMGYVARATTVDTDDWTRLRARRTRESAEVAEYRRYIRALLEGYSQGLLPTARELAAATPQAALAWLNVNRVPNNGTLVIIGDVDPAEVERLARAEFGAWSMGRSSPPTVLAAGPRRAGLQVSSSSLPNATQTHVRLGCILPATTTASELSRRDVVARLVEVRVADVVYQQTGSAPDVVAEARVLHGGTSYLEVSTAVERDGLATTVAAMTQSLRSLGEVPIDPITLAWAKLRAARARTLAYSTNAQIARAVMDTANLGFPLESLDHAAQYIAATTAKDVQDDVRACMTESR